MKKRSFLILIQSFLISCILFQIWNLVFEGFFLLIPTLIFIVVVIVLDERTKFFKQLYEEIVKPPIESVIEIINSKRKGGSE